MSKMSELSQVLDEMIACGEGMIKAANAIKDIFSSTEETPEKTEPKSTKKATKAPEPAKADIKRKSRSFLRNMVLSS